MTLEGRFWKKICVLEPAACRVWIARRTPFGYGEIRGDNGKTLLAHRVSWSLHNGAIPDGLHVLHRCDNPPCVNPAHLSVGTQADNMRDAAMKGRMPSGSRHHAVTKPECLRPPIGERNANSKLKDIYIDDIRRRLAIGESQRSIGRLYEASHNMIGRIMRGVAWKHIK